MRICALLRVAGADDRLLHRVRRVFGDRQSGARRHQHGDAARLSELQRRRGIAIDEGRLDRRLVRRERIHHPLQLVMDGAEPLGERRACSGVIVPGGDERQPRTEALDDAPASAPKAGIDANDANRLAHARQAKGRMPRWRAARSGLGVGAGREAALRHPPEEIPQRAPRLIAETCRRNRQSR